ncbi:MAG TPA: hypothetical protein PLC87_12055 [Bacteroidales bacterium]|nr:hypothetical protein [Bacteroidales bacterium]
MEKAYLFFWLDIGKFIVATYQDIKDSISNMDFLEVEAVDFVTQNKSKMFINMGKVIYVTVISEDAVLQLFKDKFSTIERVN